MEPLISVKWKDGEKWNIFTLDEINHMPRTHAINLFSGNIQVIARQGKQYITNRESTRDQYLARKQKCILFSELDRSEKALGTVGFV